MQTVRALIADVMRPGRFFVRPDLHLAWQAPILEEISWEIFRGRLLDPAHTRQTRQFTAWNIYQVDEASLSCEDAVTGKLPGEPLLSVKLEETEYIHVVRGILAHAWEGFDAGDNVIQSRECVKWVCELVGTITLASCRDEADLQSRLTALLRAAVEGTSRLPLNSVEAPLPAFSLGQLAYLVPSKGLGLSARDTNPPHPQPLSPRVQGERGAEIRRETCELETALGALPQSGVEDQPRHSWRELAEILPASLEIALRSIAPDEAAQLAARWAPRSESALDAKRLPSLLRQLFTNISLSPYTSFVDTALAFVKALVEVGALSYTDEVDLWGWLLRQLGRHLTAYDLITFHFRGANYPDALLLDAVLKRYFFLVERHTDLFEEGPADETRLRRLRRRALRQGCLARHTYQGHPVPDAPTSPGENARVLPPPHVRVPEEQLLNVLRRRRRLYDGEPLTALLSSQARDALRVGILDLADPVEWRELGAALFVDRPFGWGKEVGEPDGTPLLAHEAYSPSIARRRVGELERLAGLLNVGNVDWDTLKRHESVRVLGLPAAQVAEPARPVVSLADARRVADDFLILRTMRRGLEDVFQAFDLAPLYAVTSFPDPLEKLLVVRLQGEGTEPKLVWFDGDLQKRLEMSTDISEGFLCRGIAETPACVRVTRIWNERGEERQVDIRIPGNEWGISS